MKNFKTLLLIGLLFVTGSAMAQENGAEYEFQKHAFLNLQGGAQYTLGEAEFSKLISPNVQLGIGYQFTPWFATRLQANGWQSMGGFNGLTETGEPAPHNLTYKWKYAAPGLDFMFNLSNAFFGFNPKRVFNVTAFIGGGANIAFDNDEANKIANDLRMRYNWEDTKVLPFGRAGLELGFRLSDAVSLVVEANANILSDHYNSKKADNPDMYFNGLAGLRINLGKTYKEREIKEPEAEPQPVVTEEPVQTAPAEEPVVEEKVEEVKVEPLRRDVFFLINSSKIRKTETAKVREIVDYLNAHADAKVAVTGYADAGTGNNRINDRLARLRALSVKNSLIKDYGISADRIISDSKGSRVQPFAENNKNRVTIMIAE